MPRKTNPEGRIKLSISLSRRIYSNLTESARSHSRTFASEVREAIVFYLENYSRDKDIVWQTPLERRMQKLENRLAGLMAKLVRVSGQSLWFSTLPYTKGGLPNKPLPDKAFQILWDQSRAFAANWLKKAQVDEERIETTKVITSDEPENK